MTACVPNLECYIHFNTTFPPKAEHTSCVSAELGWSDPKVKVFYAGNRAGLEQV